MPKKFRFDWSSEQSSGLIWHKPGLLKWPKQQVLQQQPGVHLELHMLADHQQCDSCSHRSKEGLIERPSLLFFGLLVQRKIQNKTFSSMQQHTAFLSHQPGKPLFLNVCWNCQIDLKSYLFPNWLMKRVNELVWKIATQLLAMEQGYKVSENDLKQPLWIPFAFLFRGKVCLHVTVMKSVGMRSIY